MTAIITGPSPTRRRPVPNAYVEVVRAATDANLNTFATYRRNKIDKAFANGGSARGARPPPRHRRGRAGPPVLRRRRGGVDRSDRSPAYWRAA